MTKRVLGEDGKLSKVIRLNEDHVGGRKSLTQGSIACWPMYEHGIDLGRLGA